MALPAVVTRLTAHDADDVDLVAAARAGDDRAFELLYLRYQGRIGAYVRGMVRDHGRAEDITQEVFVSALRRMRETDREIAFKPWVYEIAKNACIDAFRRSSRTNEVSFDAHDALGAGDHDRLAGMGASPDTQIDTKADLDNLCGAFGGLSEVHHQILVMRELEGLSYSDIGARLGMTRPAVESTLFRARRRLGEEYEELVSGKRCLRVRAIVDGAGRGAGLRDQRRMDRHISHCQPCRRHALAAGVDLEGRLSRRPPAARIAALLPLPAFLRRRGGGDVANPLVGSQGQATVAQWSANVAGSVDPGILVGWSKAVVAAATVAVAGVGAGAAITEREALRDFASRAPALGGLGSSGAPASGSSDSTRPPASGGTSERPARSGGSSPGPGDSVRPAAEDRRPADVAGGGTPNRPAKSQDEASRGGASAADSQGPVDDVLGKTLEVVPGSNKGGSATGSSGPLGGVQDTVGNVANGTVGKSLPDVQGVSPTRDPVGDVVGGISPTVRDTVGGVLPGG